MYIALRPYIDHKNSHWANDSGVRAKNTDLHFIIQLLQQGCLFVLFDSLSPINNLSVKQGRVFLGWTNTKLG